MTQQNAALVEESSAAAESLEQQAVNLAQVVGVFHLGESGPGAAPTPVDPPQPQSGATVARGAATDVTPQPARPAAAAAAALGRVRESARRDAARPARTNRQTNERAHRRTRTRDAQVAAPAAGPAAQRPAEHSEPDSGGDWETF